MKGEIIFFLWPLYETYNIFFLWRPFSSPMIRVPHLIQVLCDVAHKEINFKTMIWNIGLRIISNTTIANPSPLNTPVLDISLPVQRLPSLIPYRGRQPTLLPVITLSGMEWMPTIPKSMNLNQYYFSPGYWDWQIQRGYCLKVSPHLSTAFSERNLVWALKELKHISWSLGVQQLLQCCCQCSLHSGPEDP